MNKRPLTRDRHDVRHPCWSPAGDRLAFIASHGAGQGGDGTGLYPPDERQGSASDHEIAHRGATLLEEKPKKSAHVESLQQVGRDSDVA